MKIKTLYVTNLGLLEPLGATQIIPYLKGLSSKGIKVFIISYEKPSSLNCRLRCKDLKKQLKADGIEWDFLVYHNRWGNIWDVTLGFFKVAYLTVAKNIHVLHARASIPVLICLPIAKIFRKKLLYDRRGTMAGDFTDDININNIFSRIEFFCKMLDILDRFIIRLSDGVVVLSERSRQILTRDSFLNKKDKYSVIPCCVDIDRFNLESYEGPKIPIESNDRNICYLGSLGTCYLFDKMLDFFGAWKKNFTRSKFIIISQTEKEFIESQIIKNGFQLDDFVILNLPPVQIPSYIRSVSVSIMFIKQVECKIGSSPTKFAESLAAGVPVCINREIGDIDEIIESEKVGVIVDDFSVMSYKKAIDQLIVLFSDKDILARCKKVAKTYFSLEMGINRYFLLYNLITSGKRQDDEL